MAARAYWQGQIRLALVSIPVEVYAATKSGATISFNQIHEPTGKRINYEKVVQGVGPVDREDIVKGYEVSKGNYVILSDEEIVECYAMSGEWDYLLRIAVCDVADYDRFVMRGVLAHPSVAHAASNFALRQVKYTTEIPV